METQEIIVFIIVGLAVLSLFHPLIKKRKKGNDGCDDSGCDCG